MARKTKLPKTLIEAVRYFADEDVALDFAANVRWPDGEQACPKCGSVAHHYFLKNQRRWKCRDCRKQFSFKVGTIFEDSPLPMSKWLPAVWMLANCKNGISSYELARALGVTQKTAWFMLHRIRLAMQNGTLEKFSGAVEADETYIGATAKNMHAAKRERLVKGSVVSHRIAVFGTLQRPGEKGHSLVRTKVLRTASTTALRKAVREHVKVGSYLYTDAANAYTALGREYRHESVSHAEEWVVGGVHTNSIEQVWSLLKRSIMGAFHKVSVKHLDRYLEELEWRFNNRDNPFIFRDILIRLLDGEALRYRKLVA